MPVPGTQPSVPISGGMNGPFVSQLGQIRKESNYQKLPLWRRQVFERMDRTGKFLDSLIPPPLRPKVEAAAELSKAISPGADALDAYDNLRAAGRSLENGDLLSAAGHQVLGALSSFGLSETSKPAKAASLAADPYVQAIFSGAGARIADSKRLARAERLAKSGADAQTIWNETGWFKGADGKWRFEIDDSQMRLKPRVLEEISAPGFRQIRGVAGDFFEHPELLSAYPEFATLDTLIRNHSGVKGRQAYFVPSQPTWGPQLRIDKYGPQDMYDPMDPDELKGWLLHELQHGTQWRERFAPGGGLDARAKVEEYLRSETERFHNIVANLNKLTKSKAIAPEKIPGLRQALGITKERISRNYGVLSSLSKLTDHQIYDRLAGEVEARNVETRMALMPWERRSTLPSLTEEFSRDSQFLLPPIRP